MIEVAARLVAVTAGLVLAGGSAGVAQPGFPLPPEAPARMPSATTLPNYRSNPPLGPEAPLSAPPKAELPLIHGQLGPEVALPTPPAATLPSFGHYGLPRASPSGRPANKAVLVPNGNGTSTMVNPDGTVTIIPTPPR